GSSPADRGNAQPVGKQGGCMMAVAVRKQPMPAPAELVERIRSDLATARVRLAQFEKARTEAAERSVTDPTTTKDYQAADHNVELPRAEIDRLTIALTGAEEKARQAEAERIAKDRAAHIEAVETKLAERNAAVVDLAQAVKHADALFRRVCSVSRDIDAA